MADTVSRRNPPRIQRDRAWNVRQFQFSYHFYGINQESFRALEQNRPFCYTSGANNNFEILAVGPRKHGFTRVISFLVMLTSVVLLASPASAAEQGQVWTLTNWDCTGWTKAHSTDDQRVIAALEHYVAGYLSGRAVALGTNSLKGVDVAAVTTEVSRQCGFRPSANLAEISLVVAHQLEGR
jgi:hypothetical protein